MATQGAKRGGKSNARSRSVLLYFSFCDLQNVVLFLQSVVLLREHVGRDEEARQQQQGDRDEQLRRERRAVVVDLRASGAADRAAALDDRAGAVRADQMLAAHL